ncbi:MAG: redoxin family protein [Planctomycetes bacterium]|nr:redoxin family protein [Planctomycetota bacterium]
MKPPHALLALLAACWLTTSGAFALQQPGGQSGGQKRAKPTQPANNGTPARTPKDSKPKRAKAGAPEDQEPPLPTTIAIGAEVDPGLALLDAEGRTELLRKQRGKVVVIHFIGMQSPTSTVLVKRLAMLDELYAPKGVEVIGVDANFGEFDPRVVATLERVRNWARQSDFSRVLFDANHVLADRLHATVIGHTFVIDAEGKLRYAGLLDDDPKCEDSSHANNLIGPVLDALLAGKAPPQATHTPFGDPLVRAPKIVAEAPVKKKAPPKAAPPPKPAPQAPPKPKGPKAGKKKPRGR